MNFLTKDSSGFERVVYAELLVPGVPTGFGDFHTEESIRNFAYGFARTDYGLDINHSEETAEDKFAIVEYFVARESDPDFTPGALVLGAQILDDSLWQDIVDGKINGFSYKANVSCDQVDIAVPESQIVVGRTEPDILDGHVHDFLVILDSSYTPVLGATGETNGHTHTISTTIVTDSVFSHNHRYDFLGNTSYENEG